MWLASSSPAPLPPGRNYHKDKSINTLTRDSGVSLPQMRCARLNSGATSGVDAADAPSATGGFPILRKMGIFARCGGAAGLALSAAASSIPTSGVRSALGLPAPNEAHAKPVKASSCLIITRTPFTRRRARHGKCDRLAFPPLPSPTRRRPARCLLLVAACCAAYAPQHGMEAECACGPHARTGSVAKTSRFPMSKSLGCIQCVARHHITRPFVAAEGDGMWCGCVWVCWQMSADEQRHCP